MYPTGVKVLAGLEEVQELPIQDILPSMEWRPQVVIAAASLADPYLLLHFSDGSAVLLSGDEDEGRVPEVAARNAMRCCGFWSLLWCAAVKAVLARSVFWGL